MQRIIMTGGHHSSALPVIELLKDKYPKIEIYWLGHKYSMAKDRNTTLEFREITGLGIPFFDLKAGKFYKTLNIFRLIKIPFGFFQAFFLLLKLKPNIIVSFGGYLAVPVVLSGKLLRIPSITHEQTVVAGYANKLISRFADKILLTWPNSSKHFNKDKVVVTGIPLRKEIFEPSSTSFDTNPSLPTVYVTAGKTGSHIINSAVKKDLKNLLKNFNLIHQTGDHSLYDDFNVLEQEYSLIKSQAAGRYHLRKFVLSNEIGEAFARADIVVSRAGAHTCYELAALKKPCLLIPIPWVSHNEQYLNAKNLADKGLAVLLEEKALEKESALPDALSEMHRNISNYCLKQESGIVKDSAERILNEIIATSKKSEN